MNATSLHLPALLLTAMASLSAYPTHAQATPLRSWRDDGGRWTVAQPPVKPPVAPHRIAMHDLRDPFGAGERLPPRDAGSEDAPVSTAARPHPRRFRHPLEAVPLESIRMVGTIVREGARHALLQVDTFVYQSRTGDGIGMHYGTIRHISETAVELDECVRDTRGAWLRRPAKLLLQRWKH